MLCFWSRNDSLAPIYGFYQWKWCEVLFVCGGIDGSRGKKIIENNNSQLPNKSNDGRNDSFGESSEKKKRFTNTVKLALVFVKGDHYSRFLPFYSWIKIKLLPFMKFGCLELLIVTNKHNDFKVIRKTFAWHFQTCFEQKHHKSLFMFFVQLKWLRHKLIWPAAASLLQCIALVNLSEQSRNRLYGRWSSSFVSKQNALWWICSAVILPFNFPCCQCVRTQNSHSFEAQCICVIMFFCVRWFVHSQRR